MNPYPHYHEAGLCLDNFQALANEVSRLVNSGQQYNAVMQLFACWTRRAEVGRQYALSSPGSQSHNDAINAVKNLWAWLKGNDLTGHTLQIQYTEPKTFNLYIGNIGFVGAVNAYGYINPHTGQLQSLNGGRRRRGAKRRATRKAARKSRRARKTRARK
jgi:hypothetical protein